MLGSELPATTSVSPSPSMSPTAIDVVAKRSSLIADDGPKLPVPSLRYARLVSKRLPTTRSRSPSPSRSTTASDEDSRPFSLVRSVPPGPNAPALLK